MSQRKLPSDEHVVALVRGGMTPTQVARQYGCSRQAVSSRLVRSGVGSRRPMSYREFIPWRVKVIHNDHRIVRRLRKYARFRLGDPNLTDSELARTHKWVAWLMASRLVVDYHPDKGFFYTDRLPTEDPREVIRRPHAWN